MLLSHVDLRVSDRSRAETFYAPIFAALGAELHRSEHWTTFRVGADETHWFGFTADPPAAARAGATRIALAANSAEVVNAIAALLPGLGAREIEGPDTSEDYYAVFFGDPDGNRLEVAYVER
jgi:catechol 2,3-dioxygenase-like lactoylglutathione lyase family enzyme